jgi:hypothetical protein
MQKIESHQASDMSNRDKNKALQLLTRIFGVARLFFRILFLIGIGVSIFGGTLFWKALSSQAWPSVKGRILSASVEKEKAHRRIFSRERIQYVYHVKGKKFVGERIALGLRFVRIMPAARQLIKKYPKGTLVTVYYNPSRFEESVLEPGLNLLVILTAAVGPFILLMVGILYQFSIRLESSARAKLLPPHEKDIPPKAPFPSKTPAFEPSRKWIIILLAALLLVLLAMQFYGDEVSKWFESIKRKTILIICRN